MHWGCVPCCCNEIQSQAQNWCANFPNINFTEQAPKNLIQFYGKNKMKSLTANLPSIINFWMQLNVLWCSSEINVFASVAVAVGNELLSGGSNMSTTIKNIGKWIEFLIVKYNLWNKSYRKNIKFLWKIAINLFKIKKSFFVTFCSVMLLKLSQLFPSSIIHYFAKFSDIFE